MSRTIVTMQIPTDAITVVAAPPETISQRNVEAVTGVPARAYLDAIRSPAFPVPVVRLGKLRLVPRAEFVKWILSGAPLSSQDAPPDSGATSTDDVDRLADEMGFETTPGQARIR